MFRKIGPEFLTTRNFLFRNCAAISRRTSFSVCKQLWILPCACARRSARSLLSARNSAPRTLIQHQLTGCHLLSIEIYTRRILAADEGEAGGNQYRAVQGYRMATELQAVSRIGASGFHFGTWSATGFRLGILSETCEVGWSAFII